MTTVMRGSYEEEPEDEDEDEPVRLEGPTPMYMPPSPEVPRSGKGIWVLVAILGAGVLGYPLIGKFDQWWDAKLAVKVAAEREIAEAMAARTDTSQLECRPIAITANRQNNASIIDEACLPRAAWEYYGARGLVDQDAAMTAGIDFIQGKQPWRN